MEIRNIVNKDVATIQNCASEPIHIPGSIQPYGVLLAVDPDGNIQYCSNNTESLLGQPPAAVLLQPLSRFSAAALVLLDQLDTRGEPLTHGSAVINGTNCDLFAYHNGDMRVLELEPCVATPDGSADIFDQTKAFIGLIERSRSLRELCHHIAEQTRSITGYDRVMIYRFDREYNGEVFAESKREDLEPLLNLHYPHTDIPPQARELYLRNVVRMIADVGYGPVPVLTVAGNEGSQLDMSDSVLRSVSPIHIQYLKNMQVSATLTISLILEGRLWGLIACHHYSPLHLCYARRKAAVLQAHFLTSQIRVRQVAEEYEVTTVVEAHLQQLLNIVPQEGDFALKFNHFTSLLPLANATGAAILHRGRLYEHGMVPPTDRTLALLHWLASHSAGLQFSTSSLVAHYPDAERISRHASGVLYQQLGDPHRDAIIWFREEMAYSINWAGDPYDTIRKHTTLNQLSPRTSFAIYREQVRFTSREWRMAELNAAARFASALLNQFHLEYLRIEEASQRLLNQRLQKANQELANINWITSHDLKEPLRKILMFSSRVMAEEGQEFSKAVTDSVARIQASARRMQTLVDDITAYNLTDHRREAMQYTDLNTIVADVLHEYDDDLQRLQAAVQVDRLPHLQVVPYQVRQLFVNLVGNAVKFARNDRPFALTISCTRIVAKLATMPLLTDNAPYFLITVRDNGIGFSAEEGDKIFDIFFRLHDRQQYHGNGIGLAICKKIVESHGGMIRATGEQGEGAAFQVFLPAETDWK